MGKPSFFVIFEDDENHKTVDKHPTEESMVKDITQRWENTKQAPALVIRGEALKIEIGTRVIIKKEE